MLYVILELKARWRIDLKPEPTHLVSCHRYAYDTWMYHCNQYLQYEEWRGVWHSSIDWPRRHAQKENGYRCCYCHADIHAQHQNRKTIAILTLNRYGHYISWHSGTPADYDSGTAKTTCTSIIHTRYDIWPQPSTINTLILILLYTCATLNVRCGLAVHTKILRSK